MKKITFDWFALHALKIQSKTQGLLPFKLMHWQKKYIHHLDHDFHNNLVRSIVLKPRQCGGSTLIAARNVFKMVTRRFEKGIVLADKSGRTDEIVSIYKRYVYNLPEFFKPMIDTDNDREIVFQNPNTEERKTRPGLASGAKFETGQDPFAGRSGTRKFAHLSEYAFYPYSSSIDEGVMNSIPLASNTEVFVESTANGMSGIGEGFYNKWMAAESGDSIYKPFFVAWYEVDDYKMTPPRNFILTSYEVDLVKKCPQITNAHLAWRRFKLGEYSNDSKTIFTPEERFKQDFPSWPEEAFLSTGRPVFDLDRLKAHLKFLKDNPPQEVKARLTRQYLQMFPQMLKVFKAPEKGKKYVIGADVAEGVAEGDFSHAFILSENAEQVAYFHGHIDPDLFGRCLVELATVYNNALIVPEVNNMGHTTLNAIKQMNYLRVYKRAVYDEIERAKLTLKLGWRTTSSNKQEMLSKLIARYRDGEIRIMDIDLLREMFLLTRESDGDVELTGKDRVVAACLACVGITQLYESIQVFNPNEKKIHQFETKDSYRDTLKKPERKNLRVGEF